MGLWKFRQKINLIGISCSPGILAQQDFVISKVKEFESAISDNYFFTLNLVSLLWLAWDEFSNTQG